MEKNGLYYFFKSDLASLEALKSIEAYRMTVRGEAGLLAAPVCKAQDVGALKLCWIDRSTWFAPLGCTTGLIRLI